VIDTVDVSAVDCYEIPRRIKEAMFLPMPASCFPYAAGARRMDRITPSRISHSLGVGRRDRLGYTIWGRSAAPSTASRLIADGGSDNLSLVSGYGGHRTVLITWLPTQALTTWVREHSRVPSGVPPAIQTRVS
jgi:hypothetical protein